MQPQVDIPSNVPFAMLTIPLVKYSEVQSSSHEPVLDNTPSASFQNVHSPHVCICVAECTHTSAHKKVIRSRFLAPPPLPTYGWAILRCSPCLSLANCPHTLCPCCFLPCSLTVCLLSIPVPLRLWTTAHTLRVPENHATQTPNGSRKKRVPACLSRHLFRQSSWHTWHLTHQHLAYLASRHPFRHPFRQSSWHTWHLTRQHLAYLASRHLCRQSSTQRSTHLA